MANGFIGNFPRGGLTGPHPDDRFVIPPELRQDARKWARSDLDRLPKINGYIGIDMAKGPDTTAISITIGGFIQSVIHITRVDYATPRTGDVMQMIADIDKVEQTRASKFSDLETTMRRDIAKAMSKAADEKFFRAMSGRDGSNGS